MLKIGALLKTALALAMLGAATYGTFLAYTAPPAEERKNPEDDLARRGLDALMDGDIEAALKAFSEIERLDPQSPLGFLLEADATWWRIYYATADLIDPDVFDVVSAESTPYDSHFEDLVNTTIHKSETRIRANRDVARNYLYLGLAYALRARLYGLRGKDLPTARAGKRMRALLLRALELDPNLTDAYLGVGIYNYFVDTLPSIIKFIKFLIRLPGGSREAGLQQLRTAAEKGELTRGEAKFYLAKDFSRPNERQFSKSLELFEQLAREYPHNPLWPMLEGSLQIRLGHAQEGEVLYRQVLNQTAAEKSDVDKALHQAAMTALRRRHPEEKFGGTGK